MSWLFSQALVEEYLVDTSLVGEQSVQSNGKPTQQAYCAPDKMTGFSRLSRFGITFKPLTENLGEKLLMLYREDFLAKTLVQPGKAQELMENEAECGEKWRGSFTKYDLSSCSWKTHQCSLLGDLDEFLETWPQWGLMRDGECWEQQMLEQTIRGTGFGLSPNGVDNFHTPNTTGLDGGSNSRRALRNRQENWPTPRSCSAMAATITPESAWNEKRNPNLETIVGRATFPTPSASDYKNQPTSNSWKAKGAINYKLSNPEIQAKWMIPTPTARDGSGVRGKAAQERKGNPIDTVPIYVQKFPTPQSNDAKNAVVRHRTKSQQVMLGGTIATDNPELIGGQLNPTWVEWLMGWPLGWTDLKPLEMDKSPSVQQQPGES
jgi:DNA (cytosine-5)-methyltransferase 1